MVMENLNLKQTIESKQERKQIKEIQRIQLDPDKKISIIIGEISDKSIKQASKRYSLAHVILKKEGESDIDIREVLNVKNIRIAFSKESDELPDWYYSYESKAIMIPRKWKSPKDLLKFVHELGHAVLCLEHPDIDRKKWKLKKRIGDILFKIYTIEEKGVVYKTKGRIFTSRPAFKGEKEKLEKNLKTLYHELLPLEARIERGAWAIGLNLVRAIKRKYKIDLLKPFRGKNSEETMKNLEDFVHGYSLGSYELALRDKIEKYKLDKKLMGIFTKKHKKEVNN